MARQPRDKLGIPVICVGNFVIGGSGKTPTALALAKILTNKGQKVGFLLRGYRGRAKGPLIVENYHDASDVGDEALLYRDVATTVVSRDRVLGGQVLEQAGVDIVIMDDGFQNPDLAKTINLLVVDSTRAWGNGCVMPAGPLRAPLMEQLPFVDALAVIGNGPRIPEIEALADGRKTPLFRAFLEPAENWTGGDNFALAYSGIGHPEKFFETLNSLSITVKDRRQFADHHNFTEQDAEKLLKQADHAGGDLITTEKDHVRLMDAKQGTALARLRDRSVVLPIKLKFNEPGALRKFLEYAFKIER